MAFLSWRDELAALPATNRSLYFRLTVPSGLFLLSGTQSGVQRKPGATWVSWFFSRMSNVIGRIWWLFGKSILLLLSRRGVWAKFREPMKKFKPQVKESKHEQHDSNRCHHRNTWKSTLSLCALPLATNRALNLLLLTPGKPSFFLYNHLHSIALIHFVYFTSWQVWFLWTISSCIAPKNWEHCFPKLLNSIGGRFMMIAWQSKSKPIFKTKPNRWQSRLRSPFG